MISARSSHLEGHTVLEQEGGAHEVKMASPPAHVVEQGKREAIEVVRRTIASTGDPVARDSNPLGLP